jgi:hypothetical protein
MTLIRRELDYLRTDLAAFGARAGRIERTDALILAGGGAGVIGFAMLNPALGLLFFSAVCFGLLVLSLYVEAHKP